MALSCDVITAGLSSYACSTNGAGVTNIWISNLDNLSAVTVTGTSTSPLVTSLTLTGTQKFWAMNPYQFTAEVQVTNQRSEYGNNTYTPSIRFRCNQITTSVIQTAYKFTRGKFAIIVRLTTGIYLLFGVDDYTTISNSTGMICTKSDMLSGIKATDFSGYDFEMSSGLAIPPYEIATSIISSITSN